jgi:hypothetical protein
MSLWPSALAAFALNARPPRIVTFVGIAFARIRAEPPCARGTIASHVVAQPVQMLSIRSAHRRPIGLGIAR